MPFSYLDAEENKKFRQDIGQFLSSKIKRQKRNGILKTPEDFNNLDRIELTVEFIKDRTYDGKYRLRPLHEPYFFAYDIARFIDFRIPYQFYNNFVGDADGTINKETYKAKEVMEKYGLHYYFEENYEGYDESWEEYGEDEIKMLALIVMGHSDYDNKLWDLLNKYTEVCCC